MTTSKGILLDNTSRRTEYAIPIFLESGHQLGPEAKSVSQLSPTASAPVPRREQDITSSTHKRLKLETLEGSDKDSGVTDDKGSFMSPRKGKLKMYMMPPMEDLEAEKKRKNAITARNNRILKKRFSLDLQEKANKLEETNKELCGVIKQQEEELKALREEVRHLHTIITELREDKRSLQISFQIQQEKTSFIQEHLHLIKGTIEEDNPTRRLLAALLERMSGMIPAFSYAFAPSTCTATSSPRAASPYSVTSPPSSVNSPSSITSPPRNTSPYHTTSPPLLIMPRLTPIPNSPPPS